jgi:homoserine kinase type II
MLAADPITALDCYRPPGQVRRIEPLASAGGWSGCLLWRVTAERTLCLRRWPREHPTPDRLRLIHSVLTHAAAQGIGFIPVPLPASSGQTFIQHEGHLWELTPWLSGRADFHARPTRPRLAAALQALARFHLASQSWRQVLGVGSQESGVSVQGAPAIAERLALVEQLHGGDLARLASAVEGGLSPDLDQRAQAILAVAPGRLSGLRTLLAAASQISLPLQPAIRDCHHDHVLFTGDEVTGLVDFGALRIDTPLTEVARLIGSLVGDDQASRGFALEAYSQLRPLRPQDRDLIELLDQSGVVLAGLNWLRWLHLERREMGDLPPIVRQLDQIAARLANKGSATFQAIPAAGHSIVLAD